MMASVNQKGDLSGRRTTLQMLAKGCELLCDARAQKRPLAAKSRGQRPDRFFAKWIETQTRKPQSPQSQTLDQHVVKLIVMCGHSLKLHMCGQNGSVLPHTYDRPFVVDHDTDIDCDSLPRSDAAGTYMGLEKKLCFRSARQNPLSNYFCREKGLLQALRVQASKLHRVLKPLLRFQNRSPVALTCELLIEASWLQKPLFADVRWKSHKLLTKWTLGNA